MTFDEFNEEKLDQLTNIKDYEELKKVAKHQHGIDLAPYEKEGHYRRHKDIRISDKRGKNMPLKSSRGDFKTVHKADGSMPTRSGKANIVQAVKDSGRVNKSPEGKKRRKAEMRANLEAKKKRRAEPFGRKADGTTTKKRTFESFMMECHNVMTED